MMLTLTWIHDENNYYDLTSDGIERYLKVYKATSDAFGTQFDTKMDGVTDKMLHDWLYIKVKLA